MMSVEARLDKLETQHRVMDEEIHGLARVCADIKDIALKNQKDIVVVKNITLTNQHDITGLKAAISALAEATYAGFKRVDEKLEQHSARFDQLETRFDRLETRFDRLETRFDQLETRFDQLEMLIRQCLPKN